MSLNPFHKTIHPPTSVEHCIYCRFLGYGGKQLVTVGSNLLKVYRLIPTDNYTQFNDTCKARLECIFSQTLHGRPTSLAAVSLAACASVPGSGARDALLMSFVDAKLVVCEYDVAAHDLSVVSLHYYEQDCVKPGNLQEFLPTVSVDPENRCAVMLMYATKLAILPFRKETGADCVNKRRTLPSYVVDLPSIDKRLSTVSHMAFLHGYKQPTLAFLCETVQTFSGRIAIRNDTLSFVVLSLNLTERVHPVIWAVSSLPFDARTIVPIPAPFTGTLVLCVNCLLYLNQNVPSYGLAVNNWTTTTKFPLKKVEGLSITLDCSHAVFVAEDQLLVSVNTGDLYVCTLLADCMRAVREIRFELIASSVLTCCMTMCESCYLFLGSRLGNSMLLRVQVNSSSRQQTEVLAEEVHVQEEEEEEGQIAAGAAGCPPSGPAEREEESVVSESVASKRRRTDSQFELFDSVDLEVYGPDNLSTARAKVTDRSYNFEVCDSILNIGPCGSMTCGYPPFLSEEFSGAADPDLELVVTSGYGKNGALSVLQRTVRPQVVTTFPLPECTSLWTLFPFAKKSSSTNQVGQREHAYLVISQSNGTTVVLQTGEAINELETNSGFSTDETTVLVVNVQQNKYIIQVTSCRVILIGSAQTLHTVHIDEGTIVAAYHADPYLLLRTSGHQLHVVSVVEAQLRVSCVTNKICDDLALLSALTTFVDRSGMFVEDVPACIGLDSAVSVVSAARDSQSASVTNGSLLASSKEIDDEEKMLYGDADDAEDMCVDDTSNSGQKQTPGSCGDPLLFDKQPSFLNYWEKYKQPHTCTQWALLHYSSGVTRLYSLPHFDTCYELSGLHTHARILCDVTFSPNTDRPSQDEHLSANQIVEVYCACFGHAHSRPFLFAITSDQRLLVYEGFPYQPPSTQHVSAAEQHTLKIKFKRLTHDAYLTSKVKYTNEPRSSTFSRQFVEFSDVGGYSGLFVCADISYWIFITSRGELRFHPMIVDGRIKSFACFNNINCSHGFIYFNHKDELRICLLPSHMLYDAHWPIKKVALRRTPHTVLYHLQSRTYVLCSTTSQQSKYVYKFTGDDKELTLEERGENFPYPLQNIYSVQLYSPIAWDPVPKACLQFDEWEVVSEMKNVSLSYEGHSSGQKSYIGMCVNFSYGEDVVCSGKIVLLDIIDVVPEPGQPLTKHKIKTVLTKQQSAPVTALASVCGYLIGNVGQKLYVWMLKDNDLVGLAFIDTHIYASRLNTLNHLIMVSDICSSVCVVRFQEQFRTLSIVGRDFCSRDICTADFLVDNLHTGFLSTDVENNLLLLVYQPECKGNTGGLKLARACDFQLAARVHTMFRVRCRSVSPCGLHKYSSSVEKRHINVYATVDGSIGYVVSVSDAHMRNLTMLVSVLTSHCAHALGLNPKAFRNYRSTRKRRDYHARARRMIDGDLLVAEYLTLSTREQTDIARKVGCKVTELVDELTEVYCHSLHF